MARDKKNRQPAKADARGKGGASANAAPAPARKRSLNPLRFFTEVRQEGRKVTWTSRSETIVSTIMVVIMAVIAAIFFFFVDWIIGRLVNFLLSLGGAG